MAELIFRPLVEIAQELRERRLTSQEVVEAAIARHERFGERLHAYCLWTPEKARETAKAADAASASGATVGPLQGVPISIKDLYAAEGLPCFAGSSRRLPADPWEKDGPIVATIRRQLGPIVGKTHMVEFAFGGTGLNSHHGAPYNPWDAATHRSPGGSSSGAGVSLLEGSAFLALGSDTAGSVRIPACMTGTVGLKVTIGRWSTEGVVPLSHTFDTPGLLARSVSDAAYGFAALDPRMGDPVAFIANSSRSLDGVRIAVDDPFFWNDCDPGIAETVKSAVDALASEGAVLRPMTLPEATEAYAVFLEGGLSAVELRSFLDQELPEWLDQLDPIMASAVRGAESVSAREYLGRMGRLKSLAGRADHRFDGIDVIATPTLCLTPPVLADVRDDADSYLSTNRRIVRNTVAVNYLGLCAITLPVGRDKAGMPVGLQLIAPAWAEERLLAIALAAERVLGTATERLGIPTLLA